MPRPNVVGAMAFIAEHDAVGLPAPKPHLANDVGPHTLSAPAEAQPLRIVWIDAAGLAVVHLLALLAFIPWLFSWTAVMIAFAGLFVFGMLGISLCYHRLLTHRGFVCPKWFERTLAVLGLCSIQDTPARWVAIHRHHHHHADEGPDPHSPMFNFLWAHIGWLVLRNRETSRLRVTSKYAKDLLQDPFYAWLERKFHWVWIVLASWAIFFLTGFVSQLIVGNGLGAALQFGLSLLIWGVFVRTVVVWHITWSVNSVTHLWGYRSFDTDDTSRNNLVIGFLANGEGWHNNHHADPRSARHGLRWWELDLTWLTIRLLAWLGLARRVIGPSPSRPRNSDGSN